ncbi:hypothetical protein Bbelb_197120, partial [Branchiostoma belcheri]
RADQSTLSIQKFLTPHMVPERSSTASKEWSRLTELTFPIGRVGSISEGGGSGGESARGVPAGSHRGTTGTLPSSALECRASARNVRFTRGVTGTPD